MVLKKEKIQNPLLKGFLKQEDNNQLYEEFLIKHTKEIKRILNKRFVMFYYKIRLISYFSKLIEFEAIKYDMKLREHNKRYNLILDKPTNSGNRDTLVDLLKDGSSGVTITKLEDFIEPAALKSLTDKQKNILYLIYIKELKDTEISKMLGVSQQSITKTKKTAIQKLRRVLNVK
ncbi:sigma factor-like helix-turn-helix DNA-binding protein [Sporosarcina sp. FSL K6-5500]|uniref:sigma factor-like helix-turn-helix DNA-binding protein n=1 Tax=Sporosarcina sp. FSL K6-5500 TaxID=2921558 RepID=UPI0030FCFFFA